MRDADNSSLQLVEICRNEGVWSPLCDNEWTLQDATVVCRELGHQGPCKPYCIFSYQHSFPYLVNSLCTTEALEIKGTASALRLLTTDYRGVWSYIHSLGVYEIFTPSVWLTQHFPPDILWYKPVTLHPLGGLIRYSWLRHS